MTSRRKFLTYIGLAPAAPLAAKLAQDQKLARMAYVSTPGAMLDAEAGPPPVRVCRPSEGDQEKKFASIRDWLSTKENRDKLESLIYDAHRNVNYLDPDIAVHRSFSMAAKIAYQRQRNVEGYIKSSTEYYPWHKVSKMFSKITGGLSDLF